MTDEIKNHTHNLDEGIVEYFDFILKGHTYRFRQPNTEELEEWSEIKENPEKGLQPLYKFISKVDENAPEFPELAKGMTVPYLKRFNEMVREEMGLDG